VGSPTLKCWGSHSAPNEDLYLRGPEGDLTRVETCTPRFMYICTINTLRMGDADLRFYISTMQDGWRKSAFLTRVKLGTSASSA